MEFCDKYRNCLTSTSYISTDINQKFTFTVLLRVIIKFQPEITASNGHITNQSTDHKFSINDPDRLWITCCAKKKIMSIYTPK